MMRGLPTSRDAESIVVRRAVQWVVMGAVLAVGYVWGRYDAVPSVPTLMAQDAEAGPSDETQQKIRTAHEALKTAMEALKGESLYNPATSGMNVYAVLSGGVDAVNDLEEGRGVDPETFAALYSDLALDEVAQHLAKDAEGRLTYKNKLVRIYPVTRLKRVHAKRQLVTGEVLRTSADDNPAP
jgi:hypothetical protein